MIVGHVGHVTVCLARQTIDCKTGNMQTQHTHTPCTVKLLTDWQRHVGYTEVIVGIH